VADQSNRAVALMSIKPEFVAQIFSGEKRVEFRKTVFRLDVSHVVIYSTTPIAAIVGVCTVEGVDTGAPRCVWRRYSRIAGIGRAHFDSYYQQRQTAVAIKILNVVKFARPLTLRAVGERHPPQSFRYLRDVDLDALLAEGAGQ
jgi:predicted transcriptional regulator